MRDLSPKRIVVKIGTNTICKKDGNVDHAYLDGIAKQIVELDREGIQSIMVTSGAIGLGNVNITLGGSLRVSKRQGGQVRFVGQVNTVRGTYDFQGRQFDLQRGGLVRFDGFVPINPSIDLTATRLISGVETRIHVGGTMRKPELTLTSNPPLEQADILSLIIFNAPANELGEGQQVSLAQRASALATGFVAGKLADSIGRALNLDVFEIQTATTPTTASGTTGKMRGSSRSRLERVSTTRMPRSLAMAAALIRFRLPGQISRSTPVRTWLVTSLVSPCVSSP